MKHILSPEKVKPRTPNGIRSDFHRKEFVLYLLFKMVYVTENG